MPQEEQVEEMATPKFDMGKMKKLAKKDGFIGDDEEG